MIEILPVNSTEDGIIADVDEGTWYAVRFRGRLCSPTWNDPLPADVYLQSLRNGTREPEYNNPFL